MDEERSIDTTENKEQESGAGDIATELAAMRELMQEQKTSIEKLNAENAELKKTNYKLAMRVEQNTPHEKSIEEQLNSLFGGKK